MRWGRWRRGSWRRIATAAIVVASGVVTVPHGAAVTTSSGEGFDTCSALPTSAMRSVTGFPVANIYIGDSANLACAQPQLTADWVSTVTGAGWRLIPTFVGKQAPVSCQPPPADATPMGSDPSTAATDGTADADTAATRMQALRLPAPNVVYDDMEAYNQNDSTCSAAVAAYLDAFISRLHSDGFRAGVYGSTASTVAQLVAAYNNSARQRPDDIWIARQDGGDTTADVAVPAGDWVHRRVRQYRLDEDTLNPLSGDPSSVSIDKDAVDGDTAAPSADELPPYSVSGTASTGHVNERTGPSTSDPAVATDNEGTALTITCQTTGESVAGDSVWDKLADGNYVSDLYTTAPGGLGFAGTLPNCDLATKTARIIAPLNGTQVDERATVTVQVDVPIAATSVQVDRSTDSGATWHSAGSSTTFSNGVATVAFTAPGGDGTTVKLRATVTDGVTNWSAINVPAVRVVAPRVTMAAAPVGTTAAAYTFSWTGVDGAARATAYDWQYQSAPWSGGFGAWSSATHVTSTTKTLTLAAGYEYCVRVRAYGLFGNVGDWSAPRCTARLLDDRAMAGGSGWARGTARGYYYGTYPSSKTLGASLTRTGTTVNRVGILATTCATCGSVYVYVGNTLVATFNLYASSTHLQQLLMSRAFAVRSKVTVTVRVHSSGKLVQIDGLLLRRNG
jgi:hypothetical protein